MKTLLVLLTLSFSLLLCSCSADEWRERSYQSCLNQGFTPPCCKRKTVEACALVPPGKVR